MINNSASYVYVTALTTREYIPGCMALARSLMKVKSKYKLIVLLPESAAEELQEGLTSYGFFKICGDYAKTVVKKDISVPDFSKYTVDMKYSFWQHSFFKLQSAGLFEYDKIILLDCDQMAVKNIDHLFEKPHMTATTCGRCIHPNWLDLSAGLIVMKPTVEFYDKLISLIDIAVMKKYEAGLQAGDQDVFNEYIPDWRNKPDLYIPEKYNICWGMIESLCKKENITPKEFYMVHFPGRDKPWNKPRYYYLWILVSYFIKGKRDNLVYKVKVYGKYRNLCSSK